MLWSISDCMVCQLFKQYDTGESGVGQGYPHSCDLAVGMRTADVTATLRPGTPLWSAAANLLSGTEDVQGHSGAAIPSD